MDWLSENVATVCLLAGWLILAGLYLFRWRRQIADTKRSLYNLQLRLAESNADDDRMQQLLQDAHNLAETRLSILDSLEQKMQVSKELLQLRDNELSDLMKQNAKLKAQRREVIDESEAELTVLEESVTRLNQRIESLQSKLDAQKNENTRLKTSVKESTALAATLQIELQSERVKRDEMEAQLDEQQSVDQGLNQQLTHWQAKFDLQQKEIAALQRELENQAFIAAEWRDTYLQQQREPQPEPVDLDPIITGDPKLQSDTLELRPRRRRFAAGTVEPPMDAPGDDLTQIQGISPAIAMLLNEKGIASFSQLAEVSDAEISRVAKEVPGIAHEDLHRRWQVAARQLHLKKYGNA